MNMSATGVLAATSRAASSEDSLTRLREATGEVVGSVFYSTMMKTMRESKLGGKFGHGGRGEEVFAAQLHDLLAQRMGKSQSGGLADAIYAKLAPQQKRMDQLQNLEMGR